VQNRNVTANQTLYPYTEHDACNVIFLCSIGGHFCPIFDLILKQDTDPINARVVHYVKVHVWYMSMKKSISLSLPDFALNFDASHSVFHTAPEARAAHPHACRTPFLCTIVHWSRYTSRFRAFATSLRHASDKSVIKGFALIRERHVTPTGIGRLQRNGLREWREKETDR